MKLTIIFLLVLILIQPIVCFSEENQTNDLRTRKKALGIELFVEPIDEGYSIPLGLELSYYSFNRRWKAYQGMEEITEPELYKIAGRMDYYKNAKQYHRNKDVNLILSVGIIIGGGVLYYYGWNREKDISIGYGETIKVGDPSWAMMFGGSVMSAVGLANFLLTTESKEINWAPLSVAKQVAEDFNSKGGD